MLKYLPGQVVPFDFKVNSNFIGCIEKTIHCSKMQDKITLNCKDNRLSLEFWNSSLKRELLFLYQWAKSRSILEKKYPKNENCMSSFHLLTLMPSHGLFVHVLRRALLFAILGIITEVGCKEEVALECKKIVEFISCFFKVEGLLNFSQDSSEEKFDKLKTYENKMLILTGRIKTAIALRSEFNGKFIACAGRCSIAISTDIEQLKYLFRSLSAIFFRNSCTNFRAGFLFKDSQWYYYTGEALHFVEDIKRLIKVLHPTVIYNIGVTHLEDMYGYNIINTDIHGVVNNLVGFAADPKFGWPGDFLV